MSFVAFSSVHFVTVHLFSTTFLSILVSSVGGVFFLPQFRSSTEVIRFSFGKWVFLLCCTAYLNKELQWTKEICKCFLFKLWKV